MIFEYHIPITKASKYKIKLKDSQNKTVGDLYSERSEESGILAKFKFNYTFATPDYKTVISGKWSLEERKHAITYQLGLETELFYVLWDGKHHTFTYKNKKYTIKEDRKATFSIRENKKLVAVWIPYSDENKASLTVEDEYLDKVGLWLTVFHQLYNDRLMQSFHIASYWF